MVVVKWQLSTEDRLSESAIWQLPDILFCEIVQYSETEIIDKFKICTFQDLRSRLHRSTIIVGLGHIVTSVSGPVPESEWQPHLLGGESSMSNQSFSG